MIDYIFLSFQTFRKLQSLGLNEEHENSLMVIIAEVYYSTVMVFTSYVVACCNDSWSQYFGSWFRLNKMFPTPKGILPEWWEKIYLDHILFSDKLKLSAVVEEAVD